MINIKNIIEDTNTKAGRVFNYFIETLIVISLIAFSIETLPNLTNSTQVLLRYLEVVVVLIFTAEYILRVLVADKKLDYIFSFFGIIDFIAIFPFYLSFLIYGSLDLRAIRMFRLLRILRVLKLIRYNTATQRFHRAFIIAKEELVLFFIVTLILLYLSAVGIYYCENPVQPEAFKSIFHSLWWAVVTLTTVGYGDVYPITLAGRIFTFFVLMIGLGVIAVPTGLVSSALSQARQEEMEDRLKKEKQDEEGA